MLQLSQAFASGVLRGEEFNSVNEAAPRLMKALADGINVPMGALRKMAEEGKLTSAVLSEALPKALGQLREESKEVQTIGGAFTVLKNNIMEMVGAQSNASGTTKAFASGINALANNLDLLAAAGGAVAVVLGARFAASITASGVAFAASAVQAARYQAAPASMAGVSTTAAAGLVTVGAAARGASAAMSLLGGPVGAVPTAVGLAATAFYAFGDSTSALAKSIGGLDQPLEDLKRKIDALPPEKRISIIMEIKDDAVKQAKTVEASFVERGNSVMGAFTGMGAVTGATMKELQGLNDRLRDAQRTGADMTPILQEAAKSAGVSQATLKSWLSNIRAARNAANDSQNLAASATAGIAGPGDFPSPGALEAAWASVRRPPSKSRWRSALAKTASPNSSPRRWPLTQKACAPA
jgi:tape measure domain-containing protein